MITGIINGKDVHNKRLNVYIADDKICAVTNETQPCDRVIDAKGCYIAPGFIDIHTHGAGGSDFLDGTAEAYLTAARVHAEHGATALVPTLTAVDEKGLRTAAKAFLEARAQNPALLGLHAEGPYLALAQKGAQEPRFIRPFDRAEYEGLLAEFGPVILRWTAAPELPGAAAFARALKKHRILPCIGHSDADFDCADEAFRNGFTHMTHLYSCMSTVRREQGFRYAGLIEYAFWQEDMTVEIIADGAHLPAALLKLIYKIKGPERIALVTDSMRAAGMPEGKSVLGSINNGLPVIVEDGVAKLPDRSAFAGSVATCDRLVRNMVTLAEVPLWAAVQMMTETPARILGLSNKGRLEPGSDADIVIFNDEIQVQTTIVKGKAVYSR